MSAVSFATRFSPMADDQQVMVDLSGALRPQIGRPRMLALSDRTSFATILPDFPADLHTIRDDA
jgi:hypothetical protein